MEQYELGVALAARHRAELRRLAARRRPARRVPGRAAAATGPGRGTEEAAMLVQQGWALEARRRASVALWSSGAAILLAAVALLTT